MEAGTLARKIRRWRILPPRDTEFYVRFTELSSALVDGAQLLNELLHAEGPDRAGIAAKIEACLNRSELVAGQIDYLVRTAQQPPFDRAEISTFTTKCQRVLRFLNHAANRYVVYEVPTSDKEMRELAPLLSEACEQIVLAVKSLPKHRSIEPFCRVVDRVETKADEVYHGGLRRRFHEIRQDGKQLRDALSEDTGGFGAAELKRLILANADYTRHVAVFFILRQVYAELERAIDACADVMDALKRMVTENV